MNIKKLQQGTATEPKIRRALVQRCSNEQDILAIEERGYSDVTRRVSDADFDLVVVVATDDVETDIAVVADAASEQYIPFGGRSQPGRRGPHACRVDVRNVRYTTRAQVGYALDAAGVGLSVRWEVDLVKLDETLLLGDDNGSISPPTEHVGEGPSQPGELFGVYKHPEGTVRRVLVNAYERSPAARRRCIEHHGCKCTICGFDFGQVYGDAAAGFIQIHHLKPLSEIGRAYFLDPVRDMRPVCANCHSVLHMRSPAYSLEEVSRMRREHRPA